MKSREMTSVREIGRTLCGDHCGPLAKARHIIAFHRSYFESKAEQKEKDKLASEQLVRDRALSAALDTAQKIHGW